MSKQKHTLEIDNTHNLQNEQCIYETSAKFMLRGFMEYLPWQVRTFVTMYM